MAVQSLGGSFMILLPVRCQIALRDGVLSEENDHWDTATSSQEAVPV